jgi:ankyrin repeat protein
MLTNNIKLLIYLFVIAAFSTARADAYTDFFRAVNVDNAGTVAELLAKGFDPNTLNEKGQVALYIAMREDAPKVAAVLLASPKLNVDAANAAGETPLMMAALQGRLDWARKLIERGAKVQKAGWSPVHYAATGPNTELLAMLLDRGANIDARAPDMSTPLMMAVRFGPEDSVRLLVKRGAEKSYINERNVTAAELARYADKRWLLPLLE